MIQLVFNAVSCAFFAWFFNFAVYEVPYLKWYGFILDKLPEYISDPLGKCPYCLAPWIYLLFTYAPIPDPIISTAFSFGWIYTANCFFSEYLG